MGKRCRGQVSMEFLMVIAFVFVLLIPTVIVFNQESSRGTQEVNNAQISQIVRSIVSNAQTVYAFGEPTTFSMSVYIPNGVEAVYINESGVNFVVQSKSGVMSIIEPVPMNVSGNISTHAGIHKLRLQAANNSVIISEVYS